MPRLFDYVLIHDETKWDYQTIEAQPKEFLNALNLWYAIKKSDPDVMPGDTPKHIPQLPEGIELPEGHELFWIPDEEARARGETDFSYLVR